MKELKKIRTFFNNIGTFDSIQRSLQNIVNPIYINSLHNRHTTKSFAFFSTYSIKLVNCSTISPHLLDRQVSKCRYTKQSKRGYLHFGRTNPEDYELPMDTMPEDIDSLMKRDFKTLDFFENYWYWRIRSESTLLDTNNLVKKSYKQLAFDMGLQILNEQNEHMVGLLELYEYLKSSPFIGPFGTIENPVIVPSVHTERIVACTGGTGDNEHVPLWFRCREGFLYRCGECDQIFMLVKVIYSLPDGVDPFPVDPDVSDAFNFDCIEKGQETWNSGEYVHWPVGNATYKQLFLEGKWNNPIPEALAESIKSIKASR